MSPERENDYFSDAMTEELTNALANVPGLRVASRLSAFAYKGKDSNVVSVGASLGVRSVVEGSVRKVGNRIRITAQLIDTATGYHLWSHTYERTLADIFAMQEEISQAIVRALPLKVGAGIPPLVSRSNTPALEAYTLYLRGRYSSLKRTCDSLRTAIEYFEQAIEVDSSYALAYSGIGECYALLGFEEFGDMAPNDAMPRAKAAVDRALSLDSELAEGHAWRGVLAFLYEYNWARAEESYRRALELKPTYSLAHTWYAVLLSALGRHEEAIARIHHAEQLDPMALTIQAVVGHTYYLARRFDKALQHYAATLEMDPDNVRVHAWTARLHYATGRYEHGLKALTTAMQRVGRFPILLVQEGRFLAKLGYTEAALNSVRELEAQAERRYVSAIGPAAIRGALGDRKEWLDRYQDALEQRSGVLPFIAVEPGADPLRIEPHFQALLRTMNLIPNSMVPTLPEALVEN
jgi:serine/threonine-protein kinase